MSRARSALLAGAAVVAAVVGAALGLLAAPGPAAAGSPEAVRPERGDAPPGAGDEGEEPAPGEQESQGFELFPRRELFAPLLADPRWPRFSASHLWYHEQPDLERVGAANFGETFALVRGPGLGGRLELGFQAGVFSVFDFESPSFDLVNSDFLAGLLGTWRRERVAVMVRLFHQSSHLGDEFLLRNRVDRVNLSFEQLDALLSVDVHEAVRVYAGGGLLVRREPGDLDRGVLQAGAELRGATAWLGGRVRPVAAVDVGLRQESDWAANVSVRAGPQLESERLGRTRLQLLFEYYDGRSPNGQFYRRRIRVFGLGLHLHF